MAPSMGMETATLGGGCFWCTEAVFEQLEGISDAVSGYAGGTKETANYEAVCSGLRESRLRSGVGARDTGGRT